MSATFNRIILLLFLLAGATTGCYAQGGFGHFNFGPSLGNHSRLQRDLQQSHLLGPDFSLSPAGILVGGGGMAVLENGLLLGGNGFATFTGSGTSQKGEANLTAAGGFFNLGYAFVHNNGLLFYPFAGFGGLGNTLEITNTGSTPLALSTQHALQPGQQADYSTGGFALEGGIGLKKLMPRGNGQSGFLIGFEFGTVGLPALQAWEHDDSGQKITAITSGRSQSYYVRLTFGGGRY